MELLEGPGDICYIFVDFYFKILETFLEGFVDGNDVFTLKSDDETLGVFGVDALKETEMEGIAGEELHHEAEGDVHATFVIS